MHYWNLPGTCLREQELKFIRLGKTSRHYFKNKKKHQRKDDRTGKKGYYRNEGERCIWLVFCAATRRTWFRCEQRRILKRFSKTSALKNWVASPLSALVTSSTTSIMH